MKKNDFLLIIIIALISIPLIVLFLFNREGNYALVKVDGVQKRIIDLNKDDTVRFETEYGYNIIEVKDGKIGIIEADCPNHDCINKGFVKRNNESIICLPHHFEITVISDNEEYDAFSR